MSATEVAQRVRKGEWQGPVTVRDRLDLSNFSQSRLPSGLSCYELDLRGSQLVELPSDLQVESRLWLDGSVRLGSLPPGLQVGSLSLRGCTALESLPEDLHCWFLDMTGCSEFRNWPQRASLQAGALILRDCVSLQNLPDWLGRLSHLDLAGCPGIRQLPQGLQVTGWLDLAGTSLSGLPDSLQGVMLRWRGVRIDARVAFQPEQITAREALAEPNAERRRVLIERMGNLRFMEQASPTVLDRDRDRGGVRQLLRIELEADEPLVGLSCCCPSTGRAYLIRVPPQTQSCHQAAAWIAGFDDPRLYHPDQET